MFLSRGKHRFEDFPGPDKRFLGATVEGIFRSSPNWGLSLRLRATDGSMIVATAWVVQQEIATRRER